MKSAYLYYARGQACVPCHLDKQDVRTEAGLSFSNAESKMEASATKMEDRNRSSSLTLTAPIQDLGCQEFLDPNVNLLI